VKFLLDTDHIRILQRQSGPEFAALAARITQQQLSDITFSVVSFHEQALGCHTYISRARLSADVVRGYAMFDRVLDAFAAAQVLPYDAAAAAEFDRLRAQRVRLATMDLRLAAIALSRRLTILTRNTRDFAKVPGLPAEDWTV
jgi:tRNA(fMet)-specific endonuclease VapC